MQIRNTSLNVDAQRQDAEDDNCRMIHKVAFGRISDVAAAHRIRPLLSHDQDTQREPLPTSVPRYTLPVDSPHSRTASTTDTTYAHSPRSYSKSFNDLPSAPPVIPFDHMSTRRRSPDSVSVSTDRESFIDFFSPSSPEFKSHDLSSKDDLRNLALADPCLKLYESPTSLSILASTPRAQPHLKPRIPQTPKPIFHRSSPSLGLPKRSSPGPSPSDRSRPTQRTLPPTTNYLNVSERADLVRKSRKLAQVFGQTPGAEVLAQQESGRVDHLTSPTGKAGKNRHHRGAMSMSNDIPTSVKRLTKKPSWPPNEATLYLSANGRRHSSPLSPEEFSFLGETTMTEEEGTSRESMTSFDVEVSSQPASDRSGHHASDQDRLGSPTSFIDLSGDTTIDNLKRGPSTQSLLENMTPEEGADEERRRKRDKLAKLHRFLGSRVPTSLVLGLIDSAPSLPPPMAIPATPTAPAEDTEASHRAWLRTRRSSSVVAFPSTWSDDLDRLKEDLNDREKAINVRRAQKMEKVFGVAPPQTLFHTRQSPSTSPASPPKAPPSRSTRHNSPAEPLSQSLTYRNLNQSAYVRRKLKKGDRPGSSESIQELLQASRSTSEFDESSDRPGRRASKVYTHYQYSLNSLNDIIDRDDTESLAELHQYLNDGVSSPALQEFVLGSSCSMPAAIIKSERRRSLPTRTSMLSIASEYSITTPKPEATDFQLRRRRAAKLMQFFGADYRVLIQDVLESIEKGLEDERKRGTLGPDEAEELLQKLRRLKTKRQSKF